MVLYLDFKLFFPLQVDPLNLKSQNQAENIPVVLPNSQIKIWDKSVKGLLSYDQTNKQTNTEIATL